MAQEQPDPKMMAEAQQENDDLIRSLGDALGLAPELTADILRRGEDALIDRVNLTDKTGAFIAGLSIVKGVADAEGFVKMTGGMNDPDMTLEHIGATADAMGFDIGQSVAMYGPLPEIFRQALVEDQSKQPDVNSNEGA